MRLLIQRVTEASVTIEGRVHSEIGKGLMVLVGIEEADTQEDIDWLTGKLLRLRIFDDEAGVMNLDVQQVGGEVMVVSGNTRIQAGDHVVVFCLNGAIHKVERLFN